MSSGDNIFIENDIAGILEQYKKKLRPVDVAKSTIQRMKKLDPAFKAMVCYNEADLLRQAELVQERIDSGLPIRPLEGIPVGIKDVFNTANYPTQMGSPLWKDFTPGNDARTVFCVKQAGGMIAGKTETAEFAVHTLGDTLNPHDIKLTPGTSSSGSAVGIALGLFPVALGTQTAGSIVRPASFCGVYGCKPSFGLIPRTGTLKTTDSLDTIGFFTLHGSDLERVFEVLRVHGPDYPFSFQALGDKTRQKKPAGRPWKVALVKTHTFKYAAKYAKEALLEFAKKVDDPGEVEVEEYELPAEMDQAHDIHAAIYNKTLSYYFKEEYERSELVSPIMNDLIRQGQKISTAQYIAALREQEKLERLMDQFMSQVDVLISLSTAGQAPPRDKMEDPDPALIWTMTHLSVVSAPVFRSTQGMPFGLQIAARRYNDYLLFNFIKYLLDMKKLPERSNPVWRERT